MDTFYQSQLYGCFIIKQSVDGTFQTPWWNHVSLWRKAVLQWQVVLFRQPENRNYLCLMKRGNDRSSAVRSPVSSITALSSSGLNHHVIIMCGSTWMLGQEFWHSQWLWSPLLSCPHSTFRLSLLPPPRLSTLGRPLRSDGDRSKRRSLTQHSRAAFCLIDFSDVETGRREGGGGGGGSYSILETEKKNENIVFPKWHKVVCSLVLPMMSAHRYHICVPNCFKLWKL